MTRLHFDDLTAITAPFGLLDDDTQARLRAWPHGVESFANYGAGWFSNPTPYWTSCYTYRARPAPLEPDYVDWSQVGPAVNHIARDEDGEVWGYEAKPRLHDPCRNASAGHSVRHADRLFPSYRRGTVDWRDSLISRPGVEE
jgi:hypothetical protein